MLTSPPSPAPWQGKGMTSRPEARRARQQGIGPALGPVSPGWESSRHSDARRPGFGLLQVGSRFRFGHRPLDVKLVAEARSSAPRLTSWAEFSSPCGPGVGAQPRCSLRVATAMSSSSAEIRWVGDEDPAATAGRQGRCFPNRGLLFSAFFRMRYQAFASAAGTATPGQP